MVDNNSQKKLGQLYRMIKGQYYSYDSNNIPISRQLKGASSASPNAADTDNLKKILEKASFFGVENISQSERQELLKARIALQKLEEVIQKEKLGKLARMIHHHPF